MSWYDRKKGLSGTRTKHHQEGRCKVWECALPFRHGADEFLPSSTWPHGGNPMTCLGKTRQHLAFPPSKKCDAVMGSHGMILMIQCLSFELTNKLRQSTAVVKFQTYFPTKVSFFGILAPSFVPPRPKNIWNANFDPFPCSFSANAAQSVFRTGWNQPVFKALLEFRHQIFKTKEIEAFPHSFIANPESRPIIQSDCGVAATWSGTCKSSRSSTCADIARVWKYGGGCILLYTHVCNECVLRQTKNIYIHIHIYIYIHMFIYIYVYM